MFRGSRQLVFILSLFCKWWKFDNFSLWARDNYGVHFFTYLLGKILQGAELFILNTSYFQWATWELKMLKELGSSSASVTSCWQATSPYKGGWLCPFFGMHTAWQFNAAKMKS